MIARRDLPRATRLLAAVTAVAARAVVGGTGLACSPRGEPSMQLEIALAQQGAYACDGASCDDVEITCDALAAIRIQDATTGHAFVSLCEPLPAATACGLGELTLPALALPARAMRVSVVVWPRAALTDPNACPTGTAFDPNGYPLAVAPMPALGGSTYVTPSADPIAHVTLGCLNLPSLRASACEDPSQLRAEVTVYDAASLVPLGDDIAERVAVALGEPVLRIDDNFEPQYRMLSSHLTALTRQVTQGLSRWLGAAPRPSDAACVHILDDVAEAVGTVTCTRYDQASTVALRAYFVDEGRRNRLLAALGLAQFPSDGLVYGLVLGADGTPLSDAEVIPSLGDVSYLEPGQVALRAGSTSASGDFVALNVPYPATWTVRTTQDGIAHPVAAVGGLIAEKLTVVTLRLDDPSTTE